MASGAMKMAFSVFAKAIVAKRANRHARLACSFMVMSRGMLASRSEDHYVAYYHVV